MLILRPASTILLLYLADDWAKKRLRSARFNMGDFFFAGWHLG